MHVEQLVFGAFFVGGPVFVRDCDGLVGKLVHFYFIGELLLFEVGDAGGW